jgi:5-methylcytosine-specific restriction protein A
LSRRAFIEAQGATCANWRNSWSFVNEHERFVIFGIWEDHDRENDGLILGRDWDADGSGRRNASFGQSRRHIDLVAREGFALLTYPQHALPSPDGRIGRGEVRTIKKFEPVLERRFLFETDAGWHAAAAPMPQASSSQSLIRRTFEEGDKAAVIAQRVERSRGAREACLAMHGRACKVCDRSMAELYGPAGDGVIEVHHLRELALCEGRRPVDPEKDLIPVCPNCHAVIHARRPAYAPGEVRSMLRRRSGGAS